MSETNTTLTATSRVFAPSGLAAKGSEVDCDFCAEQVLRAGKLLKQGRVGQAEAALRLGLARVPDHPECTAYLAVCLAAGQRKFVTAEKLLRNIISNNPYDSTAWYALGRVNLLGGRRDLAFQNFRKARQVSRDDPQVAAIVAEMDPRRGPVLSFLPRGNFLNILLGRLRAKLGA